ncbi:MAG: hypothetical protein KN64_03450 [Sulfurovum sp. AS07-7]|nr:MAG: hypothetical protein KN64_03450 [Sulfurovum sp. AS07-7]
MVKELIVKFSYALEASKSYHRIKRKIYQILEDQNYKNKKYFDIFMIFLVISTVASMLYTVNHKPHFIMTMIENIAIGIFILEWFLRLWVNGNMHNKIIKAHSQAKLIQLDFKLRVVIWHIFKEKLDFIFSPMSIIDILAILPYYRPLRILRIFMLFRLFKVLRYTNSISQLGTIFIERKFDFLTLLILFVFVVFVGSSVLYVYEGHDTNDKIGNFFDAIYWAVITVTTVGYGDISPVTQEGRVATIFLVISGFIVLAFGNAIITSAMLQKLESIKENNSLKTLSKLKDFHVICGFSKSARILCRELKTINEPFIIIDKLPPTELKLQEDELGYKFIHGEASSHRLIEQIFFKNKVKSLIAMSNNDAVNTSILLNAKSIKPHLELISIVNVSKNEPKLRLAGATKTIMINNLSAYVCAGYIRHPIAFEAVERLLVEDRRLVIDTIDMEDISFKEVIRILDMNFKKFKIILIGISNGNDFRFNPQRETSLLKNDVLIVVGYESSIKEFRLYLHRFGGKK